MRLLHAFVVLGLVGGNAHAEPADTMLSPREAAQERAHAAGAWQGNWRVMREDARIRTRAAAEALHLHVIHDAGGDRAEVQWSAGRAICADPLAEPCEWIGAQGSARATVTPQGLYAVLPISTDETDPFFLHLAAPTAHVAHGLLLAARDGPHLSLRAQRER